MNRSILLLILVFTLSTQWVQAQAGIRARLVGDGFTVPVDLGHAPGLSGLFVVEKPGLIKYMEAARSADAQTVLDIQDRVRSSGSEQGLLGLAFHPDFPDSAYLYVNYIDDGGDTQVSRFTMTDLDQLQADPASEKPILDIGQPFSNHNAGDLAFGPDGMLYLTSGDGGSGGDPEEAGQDRLTFLGKILRIDIDQGDPYAIPSDNPFAMDDFTLDEIWALGLRNPWRMSFDRATGDLWIGDVGQGVWEEINRQPAESTGGENYGWDCYEAEAPFESTDCPDVDELAFPVFSYRHNSNNGCSVTGGFVYRGAAMTEFQGKYFLADYCSGRMWTLTSDGEGGWREEIVLETGQNVTTFGEDADGELYYATWNGEIYLLESSTTSVEERDLFRQFSLQPNPASDQTVLQLRVTDPGRYRFQLLDLQGRLLQSWEETIWDQYEAVVDLNGLAAGRYILGVEKGGQRVTRPLVKAQ